MIDPKLLGDLAKDHQKNVMTRDEARAFLKDLMAVCRQHRVFLRTADQTIRILQSVRRQRPAHRAPRDGRQGGALRGGADRLQEPVSRSRIAQDLNPGMMVWALSSLSGDEA
ncbi:MAG: hypothetical protein ACMVO3_16205 [Thalassobaculum sp.]